MSKCFDELSSEWRSRQDVEDEAAAIVQVVDMYQDGEQHVVDRSLLRSVADTNPVVLSNSE